MSQVDSLKESLAPFLDKNKNKAQWKIVDGLFGFPKAIVLLS